MPGRIVRLIVPGALLVVLLFRVPASALLDAVRAVTPASVLVAVALTVATTACNAWRWRVVSAGLGHPLGRREALQGCARALFLNVTLPGGVTGDVARAVEHGHRRGDYGRPVRSVVWERAAGQAVQVVVTAAVLVALPSPWQRTAQVLAAVVVAVVAVVLGAAVGARLVTGGRRGHQRPGRVGGELRAALLGPGRVPVVAASSLALLGHATLLLVAARTAGLDTPLTSLLPLLMLVLLASAVPLNLAGWGPREGVAAAAFAAAGLGAVAGVQVSVVYGVLVLLGALPAGVALLVPLPPRPAAVDPAIDPAIDPAAEPTPEPVPEVVHG